MQKRAIGLLEFKPIDVKSHSELSFRFLEDGFLVAFGNADRVRNADGKGFERYVEHLNKSLNEDPWSCVHGWLNGEIVGQIELSRSTRDPSLGYVVFVYLVASLRGQGFSEQMAGYMANYFLRRGYKGALVSVSRTNIGAVRFYTKFGWQYESSREDIPELDFMKLTFPEVPLGK